MEEIAALVVVAEVVVEVEVVVGVTTVRVLVMAVMGNRLIFQSAMARARGAPPPQLVMRLVARLLVKKTRPRA